MVPHGFFLGLGLLGLLPNRLTVRCFTLQPSAYAWLTGWLSVCLSVSMCVKADCFQFISLNCRHFSIDCNVYNCCAREATNDKIAVLSSWYTSPSPISIYMCRAALLQIARNEMEWWYMVCGAIAHCFVDVTHTYTSISQSQHIENGNGTMTYEMLCVRAWMCVWCVDDVTKQPPQF